jgi:hypothetical protein
MPDTMAQPLKHDCTVILAELSTFHRLIVEHPGLKLIGG